MLRVENVGKSFGALAVLRGIDLEAATGQITGVIGPNGAGKSTLLNVVGGLFPHSSGRILLAGTDVSAMAVHERARRGLVRTFQISRELGELTVLENLMLARPAQCGESVLNALLRPRRVRNEERTAAVKAKRILDNVGLWRLADAPARALSGGQKKLLELSRALMLEPKIILLDEPAAGVSPPMRVEISKVIRALCREGLTFVIVEHDMDMIASLCDHVYVMAEGKNLTSGTFQEVVADDRVVRAYLGGVA
jgi:ABC-type branched-subunit amino acid transport system ATPase component